MREEGGGSQHGVPPPEVSTPFAAAGMEARAQLLGMPGASDQRLQPPKRQQDKAGSLEEQQQPMRAEGVDFDAQLAAPEASESEFPDEEAAALADVASGEEAERGEVGNGGGGGGGGNRWPREETLALLRIRSEMDAAFRDASLKGPLWEDVSRKLAELGYKRSAKKCREKFENVHKYYKRTREGRAGRQDGKSYKFFTQLEALNGRNGGAGAAPAAAATVPAAAAIGMVGGSAGRLQPTPLNAIPLSVGAVVPPPVAGANSPAVSYPSGRGISFSSDNSFSASGSEEEEEGHPREPRKRRRGGRDGGGEVGVDGGGGGERRKMIAFFEGLMRQVMERQEAMQQKLLEMIEKREQDRMIREEAWRRQEMARLTRENEAMAQEREIAASRDATIIAFLHKMTGQTVPTPTLPVVAPSYPVAAQPLSQLQQAPPPPGGHQPQAQQQQQRHSNHRHGNEVVRARPASPQQVVADVAPSTEEQQEAAGAAGGTDPVSSRWPKPEVHALIKLRSVMETEYQETGPKGPLWEEIAAGMRRMGYSGRSAKRCKEKWENINKYFKKVKDSSKKRPEDAKTCPYFHQLDALYRKKFLLSAGAGGSCLGNNHVTKQESEGSPCAPAAAPSPFQLALPQQSHQAAEAEAKSHGDGAHMSSGSIEPGGNGALTEQARHRNGGIGQDEGVSSDETSCKEPEDAMKRPADRQQHAAMDVDYDKMEETESDSMDLQEEEEDDEDEEKIMEMEYRVEYHQRPAGVNGAAAAASNGAAGESSSSFVAMVQ
ncbi:hypothetical protein Taro_039145 [Colocasia esculenta]|uniref:Myb-like domain-containing protein n=1 Tax=Colocasia esculenta TaxID=4460 RepID=A0A843W8J5_COLES|nr:hypothetical protein [Colocasia esculenta]